MRVLHVVTGLDPRVGGPAVALEGLAQAQVRAGLHVEVLAMYVKGADLSVAQSMRNNGVVIHSVGPAISSMLSYPGLRGIAGSLVANVDLVHTHALWESPQHHAIRWAMKWNMPYIVRPCGMLDPWALRQSWWKKKIYMLWRLRKDLDRASAIHYTTDAERDLAGPLRLRAPSIVEPNGVNLAEFGELPAPGLFRAAHPQVADRRIILFLSRLHPKKGLDLLIPAFAQLNRKDAVLVIAGPDEDGYRAVVEGMIAKHQLQDRVVLLDILRREKKAQAMVDAELFVLPSYQENFGVVVVEALAARCPVIVSEAVNLQDQVTAAGVGAVVPLDQGRLAAELQRWLDDPALRASGAARSRDFVMGRFDWDAIARRWSGHYKELLDRQGPPRKPMP